MIEQQTVHKNAMVSRGVLRQFAGVWLLVFAALSVLAWSQGRAIRAAACGVIAVTGGLPGLLHPSAMAPLFLLLTRLTRPIGVVTTHVLLAVVFYGLFTPTAIIFRLTGRDALVLKRANQGSTWRRRSSSGDIGRYLRQ